MSLFFLSPPTQWQMRRSGRRENELKGEKWCGGGWIGFKYVIGRRWMHIMLIISTLVVVICASAKYWEFVCSSSCSYFDVSSPTPSLIHSISDFWSLLSSQGLSRSAYCLPLGVDLVPRVGCEEHEVSVSFSTIVLGYKRKSETRLKSNMYTVKHITGHKRCVWFHKITLTT